MLKVGSLFAGIGGMDLGLERAGMRVVWQVEIDEFCRRVLAKHWPKVKRYTDVREVRSHNLEPVDLICGGFPCQPVSVAGKQRGDQDERWLWPEFCRVIRELRPRWVLAENVPGLLSVDAGRVFGGILRDLATCGYAAEWDCVPAKAVGAPHQRDRVFVVAYPDGGRLQERPQLDGQATPDAADGNPRGEHADRLGHAVSDPDSDGRSGILRQAGQGAHEPELRSDADRESSRVGEPGPARETGADVRNAEGIRREPRAMVEAHTPDVYAAALRTSWWETEPRLGRVADGVPGRVDRLKGLGNAVVPQVAEWIGRRIVEVERTTVP